MKKVKCTNDKNQPEGGEVREGETYTVESEFMNNYGQRVYIIQGVNNGGHTKLGMLWHGYDATRFSNLDSKKEEKKEVHYALN